MDESEGVWQVRWRLVLLFFSYNSILIIIIHHIFSKFDGLKKTIKIQSKNVNMSEQTLQYICIASQNSIFPNLELIYLTKYLVWF